MRLVDRVLAHAGDETRCSVDPARSALFQDASGRIPVWVGIEYMAQCAAVHGGLVARARGDAPLPGLFLGSRSLAFHCDHFEPGAPLVVTARHVAGRSRTLAFACAVHDAGGATLAEGRLHVLPAPDLGAPERAT
jgi:predicted hotdog family 3-hydroxylacyl-ACP dehydratase